MLAEAIAPERAAKLADHYGRIAAPTYLDSYVLHTFAGEYDLADHHRLIIEKLEAVERGEIKRLMICMPPRRGKSELASVRFPAWYLGRHPDRWVMACSHTVSLANRFSRLVRRQITDATWPFPGISIRDDEAAVGQWGIKGHEGGYISAGVGVGIAGKGGSLIIIDDPVKSREHAKSAVYRDRVHEWYQSDVWTRRAPDAAIVIITTRWHEDDLAGRLLREAEEGGEQWVVLQLRERCEEGDDDPLGREPGAVLWPSRYPASDTDAIRRTQPYVWEPLYQQRPSAVTGGMYQREWMTGRFDPDVVPEFEMVAMVCDSAFGEDVSADPSGIQVWGATPTHFYLLDDWNERAGYPALIAALKTMYAKWEHLAPWVWIENKASGQSAIQTLRDESSIPVRGFNPKGSKESRGQDASRFFAARRVLLPRGREWVHDVVEELCAFPTGAHDERVDCAHMAISKLARAVGVSGEPVAEGDNGAVMA